MRRSWLPPSTGCCRNLLRGVIFQEASTTKSAVNAIGAKIFPQPISTIGEPCGSLCRTYVKGPPCLSKSYVRRRMFDYPARGSRHIGSMEHDSSLFVWSGWWLLHWPPVPSRTERTENNPPRDRRRKDPPAAQRTAAARRDPRELGTLAPNPTQTRMVTGFRASRCISAKMGFLTCDKFHPYRPRCCAHWPAC